MKKTTNSKTATKTVKLTPAEAAAKHIAMQAAQKQAELDAKTAMLADAASGNESPAEVKPELPKIERNKPVPVTQKGQIAEMRRQSREPRETVKPVAPVVPESKPESKKPFTRTPEQVAADKAKKAAEIRSEYVKIAAALAIRAGYVTKENIVYRGKRESIKAGDVAVLHNPAGHSQIFLVEHISKTGTLSLELYRDDDKNNRAGSAGSWTAETWDFDYLRDIHTKRKDSYMKKRDYAFFGKK